MGTIFPELVMPVIFMVRGVGFEPTNPYGTGASVQSFLAKMPQGGGISGDSSGALLNPVTAPDGVTIFGNVLDWNKFQDYVKNNYSKIHASAIMNYAKRYWVLLAKGDLSDLLTLSRDKRRHVLAALAALSRFLGKYDEFKALKEKYGLKIESNVKIAFQMDDSSLRELCDWIIKARNALGEYAAYIDLLLATGMRPREAITCYNLIIKLNAEGRLDGYYREGWLEHFRFENLFCRRSKNVYVSYAPPEVVTSVTRSKPISSSKVKHALENAGLEIKLKHIRKLWASYMTRHLTEPEINLLQGRVGKSVFMAHYFNPSYLIDLKSRLERGVKGLFAMVLVTADNQADQEAD